MLTVKRAAEILGVSPALIYAACAKGDLRHERFGVRGRGTIRITEEALAEYRERGRVDGGKPSSRPAEAALVFKHLDPTRLASAWGHGSK